MFLLSRIFTWHRERTHSLSPSSSHMQRETIRKHRLYRSYRGITCTLFSPSISLMIWWIIIVSQWALVCDVRIESKCLRWRPSKKKNTTWRERNQMDRIRSLIFMNVLFRALQRQHSHPLRWRNKIAFGWRNSIHARFIYTCDKCIYCFGCCCECLVNVYFRFFICGAP